MCVCVFFQMAVVYFPRPVRWAGQAGACSMKEAESRGGWRKSKSLHVHTPFPLSSLPARHPFPPRPDHGHRFPHAGMVLPCASVGQCERARACARAPRRPYRFSGALFVFCVFHSSHPVCLSATAPTPSEAPPGAGHPPSCRLTHPHTGLEGAVHGQGLAHPARGESKKERPPIEIEIAGPRSPSHRPRPRPPPPRPPLPARPSRLSPPRRTASRPPRPRPSCLRPWCLARPRPRSPTSRASPPAPPPSSLRPARRRRSRPCRSG